MTEVSSGDECGGDGWLFTGGVTLFYWSFWAVRSQRRRAPEF